MCYLCIIIAILVRLQTPFVHLLSIVAFKYTMEALIEDSEEDKDDMDENKVLDCGEFLNDFNNIRYKYKVFVRMEFR